MHKLSLGLVLSTCACTVIHYGSNLADGGLCPAYDGGGSGSLSGPLAFPVTQAYEAREAIIPWKHGADGGFVVPDGGGGASPFIYIVLLGSSIDPVDGGCCWQGQAVFASIPAPQSDGTWNGAYGFEDGGASLGLLSVLSDGGGSAFTGVSGQLTIASTQACSLSGSFIASLSDAGGVSAGPLNGTFQALYVP